MNNTFYVDNYLKTNTTRVIDCFNVDEKNYVVLEDSIFYPQGGGQKGDRGKIIINNVEKTVLNTIKSFDERYKTLLIVENLDMIEKDSEVECLIDFDFRYRQMRLHSALHIHHLMIEKIVGNIPHPVMSNIDDGSAFNKYECEKITVDVLDSASILFVDFIKKNYEITTYSDEKNENYRYWKCLEHIIPCGGTHVKNTSEIGNLEFVSKEKKGHCTIMLSL